MDLNFQYSNNNSPNFAGIFARTYERINENRQERKAKTKAATAPDAPAAEPSKPEPAPGWNPVRRARPTTDSHSSQAQAAAQAVQTYTGKATRATEGRPASRVTPAGSTSRQFDPARRRALPYQQEDPVGAAQSNKMGKHAKPEQLGRHAAGSPPAYETRPIRPGYSGRHAL